MKKIILISLGLGVLFLAFYCYKISTYTHINAKFKELRPIHGFLPVYYKGIVIGKAKEKRHTEDFNHTIIKIVLYPKKLLLPDNTEVYLKKEKRNKKERDFLELIYPDNPSNKMIADNTTLKGIATVDVDTFLSNQKTDDLELIKQNLVDSSEQLSNMLSGFSELFVTLNDTVNENRNNIKNTTGNIKKTTGNLENATFKVNNSLKQDKLDNSFTNIEASVRNIENLTSSLTVTADDINQTTMKNVEGITNNVNIITCGIRKTLSKKMGGLRLFFTKVID